MKAFKLTKEDLKTRYTKWIIGIPVTAEGNGPKLCSDGWIHFYIDPIIAVLMNPAHANFNPFRMFECETSGEHLHEPLKSGCKTLTITKEITPPEVTVVNRIAFGILCTLEIEQSAKYMKWAKGWLDNNDRSRYASDAANAASYTASACSAAYAAGAYNAAAAAYNATAACAAATANAAAYNAAAASSYAAAYTAAYNAAAAANAAANSLNNSIINIDFIAIANKALTYK